MALRIGGLATGMDIDSLVKDLMKAERIPFDKLTQKKKMLEWQRDDYRSMNKLLDDLDKVIFGTLGMQSNFTSKKVTSSAEHIVSATAKTTAVESTANLSVTSTATSAIWVSGTLTSPYSVQSDTQLKFDITNGDKTTSAGVTIDLKAGDNLDAIITKFNSSGLGVSAFYDSQKQTFVLTKKETGISSSIKVADATTASFMSNELKFSNSSAAAELTGKTDGKDALISINGYSTTRSSNTFELSGVVYTIKQAGTANISISKDIDMAVEKIKEFVDKYNETIERINSKISETRYRDFLPLTDEQRKEMSEKEAELWDQKSMSGMLKRDSILSAGLLTLRQQMYGTVATGNTKYDVMSEIGITTSRNYLQNGKLEIKEDKLRQALSEDPDAVMNLFSKTGSTPVENGIATRLRDSIKGTIKNIEAKAGNSFRTNDQFTLGKELIDVNKRMIAFEDRLVKVEDRYWRQFQAMESAIQRLNQQGSYLMQQFGGGQ